MIVSILKIIGTILLILIGIILLLLFIILTVPIRYQFAGAYEKEFDGSAKVSWLPVLLKATVSYQNNELQYIVKLLGGVIMTNTDAKISWLGRKLFEEKVEDSFEDDESKIQTSSKSQKDTVVEEKVEVVAEKIEKDDIAEFLEERKAIHEEKKNLSIFERIRQKLNAIKDKIFKLIENLKKLNQKREKLQKVYESKRFEVAKTDAIRYVKKLFRKIKPKLLEGRLHFGLENPATTGQLFGICAMFLPYYEGHFDLIPEFEYSCIEGNVRGKGKFALFPIVAVVLKVIFNKNLIKVVKRVQTIIEN